MNQDDRSVSHESGDRNKPALRRLEKEKRREEKWKNGKEKQR